MRKALSLLAALAIFTGMPVAGQNQQLSEQVFKNVQSMKGIPVKEFMATMGFFSASLGENCTYCHVAESSGDWARYADDNAHKVTARRMIAMVGGINKSFFGGRRVVTCYSCHRGGEHPETTPSLADLYGPVRLVEPDQLSQQAPNAPAAEQVLDKYLQAIGGAQKVAAITSLTATGTYEGYTGGKSPFELFAKAPNQLTTVAHTGNGDNTTTFDGRNGWVAAPVTDVPAAIMELTGGDLDGARLDAQVLFPATIKQALTQWRTGFPISIDDHEARLVQGTRDGKFPVNLYFDSKSGLLVRTVRYADSPVGLAPTQVDYSDYRDVNGVKMPFKWVTTWLDGRSTTQLSEVQANAPVAAAKFAKPAPSAAPKR